MDSATHVSLGLEKVSNITAPSNTSTQLDNLGWLHTAFCANLLVNIIQLSKSSIEFDLIGIDASIANALRRIMIAELPTVAIEHVYIWINTSLVQDEVLAQRLGLIPILCDPERVEWRNTNNGPNDANTIVFKLSAACDRIRTAPVNETEPARLFTKPALCSGDILFAPKGDQPTRFPTPPKPVFTDIVIAKLRPGQEVVCEMHCEKGIGRDHAKWSPVATASYRLLPAIEIIHPIPSMLCEQFANCFPDGVIRIDQDSRGMRTASVQNARLDTVSREVLRHPLLADKVRLGRKRDHFIFNIESVGQYVPQVLLTGAIRLFKDKLLRCRLAASNIRGRTF